MTDQEQPEDIQNQTQESAAAETEAVENSTSVEAQLETALAERDENQNRFLRTDNG